MKPRRGGVAAPSLAAGVLLALSVPPFGVWPLAFVGAAFLYWRLRGLRLRARLLAGWLAGVGCFAIGLFWAVDFNWYGAVTLVVLEALAPMLAAAATTRHRGRSLSLTGAATLAEAVRVCWPFGGLPVGGVFLGQAGGPLLGAARLGGPLLLTALVWGGGAGLGELASTAARWRRGSRSRPALAGPIGVALVIAFGVAGALAPDGGAPTGTIRVAAVQGGGTRGFTAIETGRSGDFAAELAASSHLVGAVHQTLVVWPEDVVALTRPLAGSPEAARISTMARTLRTTLLAGVTITQPNARFLNEIVAWGPDGRIVSTFEKVHRVPFGEYVPLRGLFSHLANLDAVPRDAVPGHASGLMTTPAGRLGLLVSYEVFFADRGRSSVRAGAQLLVVPTNTSSYSSEQMPSQEVAADRVQAVEEGRDLVQAAPTGYSTFVTNTGAVRLQSELTLPTVLASPVALRRGATLYERFGDLPVLVLAALALVAGQFLERRRRVPTPDSRGEVSEESIGAQRG